ncbi:hypothetical protein DERP_000155 [Dermatophagoides pteronyssinus]|uniref:CDP-diacylglycerol--inositol 3-phosphatidyltransferase n=1 Tax=Dermatophagoides pteronyssinus TaxID=6956 RepID=A0ABQ8IZZ6_DERPT|nr:hypothetical protein DERP_000155 [Dermatophagoides pteronyssinus]
MEHEEQKTQKNVKEENIFLFVPNLIGYARIILALVSFYTMQNRPITTLVLYFLSTFLDAFDGYAARRFNQSTRFGAMLDQLTDRCGTMCLLFVLGTLYPAYLFWLQLSAVIDIASHWMHLQVSLMCGRTSHKMISLEDNPILYLYYNSRPVLFVMCFFNELFYVSLYMLYFFEGPTVFGLGLFRLATYVSMPIAILKAFISILQLIAACYNCQQLDLDERRHFQIRKAN